MVLSLAGYDSISTTIDASESYISVRADIKEADGDSALTKAKEAIIKLSIAGIKGSGGLLSLISEPVIKEGGKLYMKVKLPFAFIKSNQPEQL